MADREMVIKGIECLTADEITCNTDCPYFSGVGCVNVILRDALELLKEQEPKTAITNPEKYGDYLKHCPSCETVLPISSQYGRTKFCHLCGQAVKWNEVD